MKKSGATNTLTQKTRLKLTAEILKNGGVGILPTDTIYGLVGSALLEDSVKKIYKLRKRNPGKPMIILIGSIKDLSLFKIRPTKKEKTILNKVWPGKVSVVLPCVSQKFSYLHCGEKSLAFRLPQPKWLNQLLSRTGPLVAPSANREGKKSALTIKEAKKYFGKRVDFYFDSGKLSSLPSTLITLKKGKVTVLREGVVKIRL